VSILDLSYSSFATILGWLIGVNGLLVIILLCVTPIIMWIEHKVEHRRYLRRWEEGLESLRDLDEEDFRKLYLCEPEPMRCTRCGLTDFMAREIECPLSPCPMKPTR
jgi:hypothetical protein